MTPAQFFSRMKRPQIAPAYLFLGPEDYQRRRCREALLDAALAGEDRQSGLTQYDLNTTPLAAVIDDARSLSLFASRRVILASNAEAALPRARATEEAEENGQGASADELAAYLRDPVPGVVLVFDCRRYDFESEDKPKLERVRKFFSAVPETVELRAFDTEDARQEAEALARRAGLDVEAAALDLLAEALGADMARIATEIEKLALYAGKARRVTPEVIGALVPEARSTTIFALVNALGRRDRARALEVLDTLCKEGEYLPLALAFLSTQFRLALVAKEAGLRTSQQIQAHFSRLGVPMWGSRADQVWQTTSRFSKEQLAAGMRLIFEADTGLRSARPDDRIVMERFVLELTA